MQCTQASSDGPNMYIECNQAATYACMQMANIEEIHW